MAIRNIVKEGDPILNKVCRPVTNFDDRLATLLDDMRETLGLYEQEKLPSKATVVVDLHSDGDI